MKGLTVRELPVSERPRERLMHYGSAALAETELLACVLGRGIAGESVLVTARRLLAAFGTWRGIAEASVEQLTQVRGVGQAKAVQLKAVAELARRLVREPAATRPRVDSAEAAAALVRAVLVEEAQEHVVALLVDQRHRLIRMARIAVGSLSASLVHPREVFKEAIAASAAAVILAHNHPSGDPEPSEADVALTRRLAQAGALMGIEVLDHLIVARGGTVSLRAVGAFDEAGRRGRARRRRAP